jgi:hypothetical protein
MTARRQVFRARDCSGNPFLRCEANAKKIAAESPVLSSVGLPTDERHAPFEPGLNKKKRPQ